MNAPTQTSSSATHGNATTMTVTKGNQLINSFKSEVRKVLTLRSTIVWAILFTGSLYGFMVLKGVFSSAGEMTSTWADLATGSMVFMLLATVWGASTTAGEFNNKMNAHAFLTQKGRWHWLVARLFTVVLFIEILWFVGIGLSWAVAALWPGAEFVSEGFTAIWANTIAMPVYALIGAGVAALTRSRVAGLTLPLVWILVIETILYGLASKYKVAEILYNWSPGHVSQDITLRASGVDSPLMVTTEHGLLVFAIWVVVAVGAGLTSNQKRDAN
ncbi:ABC-2 family transporter protein [Corynebacterium urogenitale]|uniref:ABC-2 family transporter protein n=1 Tax=Corynebacterium urogenitale TaxID=2487892 RepID=A0A5J6Z7H5_9CORY|nr:ABC transporter permease [Corynebacterium urogenitale]QFQ02968.1 ABC-2 family transporter protein [Corynebacterium urogenitale]